MSITLPEYTPGASSADECVIPDECVRDTHCIEYCHLGEKTQKVADAQPHSNGEYTSTVDVILYPVYENGNGRIIDVEPRLDFAIYETAPNGDRHDQVTYGTTDPQQALALADALEATAANLRAAAARLAILNGEIEAIR